MSWTINGTLNDKRNINQILILTIDLKLKKLKLKHINLHLE